MSENLNWQKIFSGQFVFTVVAAWAFAYAVVARLLTNEQVYLIITMVITYYFNKPKNGGSDEKVIPNSGSVPNVPVVSTGTEPKP
jgi:hypothetical protein